MVDEPYTADFWRWLQQQLIKKRGRDDFTIAALQLYSDKTLLNFKGVTAHPVRATFLNILYEARIKNLV